MRRFINVRTRLFNTPLLLTEEYASVVATAMADRLDIEPLVSPETLKAYVREPRDRMFELLGFEPADRGQPASDWLPPARRQSGAGSVHRHRDFPRSWLDGSSIDRDGRAVGRYDVLHGHPSRPD